MFNFEPNELFPQYIRWIVERQNIFWARYYNEEGPHSDDPIMQKFKFTNVYRALDRTSQYLLREVIYNGRHYAPEDMFWRILVFKHFNLPSTWELLCEELGDINLQTNITKMISVVERFHAAGRPIYSNAYMLTASFMKTERIKEQWGIAGITKKHEAYLRIFQHQILEAELYNPIIQAPDMRSAYNMLRTVPTVGPFLAYQYVQDLNYTDFVDWDDNSFCAAGYGTIRGVDRTFKMWGGKPDYGKVVMWVEQNFESLLRKYDLFYDFAPLPGRMPQVPDLSNCFCEVDKYLRQSGVQTEGVHGKRMKNNFSPNPTRITQYVFPPKWNIYL